ncbi:MAG: biopolymer transporter ExbD [Candidatus Omnitrophica bacterium]|nr:biopolymer transporter ExbD [Candidatus Omnitrophota bacterium]
MRIPQVYQKKRARIEIIPLIDIIFFLLATFVMVSLSMVKNQGITVNLPVAATGQTLDRTVIKTVTVTMTGDILLDKDLMDVSKFVSTLKKLKAENNEVKVLINADDAADFGVIVKVLDEVRKIGIGKVSIQTKGADTK